SASLRPCSDGGGEGLANRGLLLALETSAEERLRRGASFLPEELGRELAHVGGVVIERQADARERTGGPGAAARELEERELHHARIVVLERGKERVRAQGAGRQLPDRLHRGGGDRRIDVAHERQRDGQSAVAIRLREGAQRHGDLRRLARRLEQRRQRL